MNLEIIKASAPLLTQGMLMTIKLWAGSLLISLSVGSIFGIMRSRRLRMNIISPLCDGITFVLRGVPFYVQLLIIYFVLPDLCNINVSPATAGITALGLCSAAYVSQMVRGGMNAIPDGQWEAAQVLGMNTTQTLFYIILPQTLRTITPMLTGELDQVLKSTSVVSYIGVLELTRAGMNIIACEMTVAPVYLAIALMYLAASTVLNAVSGLIEKKLYKKC